MTKKKKFYKKAKPKESKKKLPNNSLNITEKLHSDHVVFLTGIVCLSLAIVVVSYDFYINYKMQKKLAAEKIKVSRELNYWEREVANKEGYRDGYFSLALIYYQLKDFRKASENLEKTMLIDPNFEKGKELRLLLEEE